VSKLIVIDPKDDFVLPVFDRPMQDPPCTMTYEQAVAAFEEFAATFKSTDQPRIDEDIPEFKL